MAEARTHATGALLGTFVGDALGAAWEGSEPIEGRDGGERALRSLEDAPLRYTDDTQLTIALGEHLLEHPRAEPQALAERMLEHVEPWRGYGRGMIKLVEHWRLRVPVDQAATAVFEDGSYGNGASMRAAPVGVLWRHDLSEVDDVARRQARTTHLHRVGQDGAAVQAAAVALAADRGRFGITELCELADVAQTPEVAEGLKAAGDWVDRWNGAERPGCAEVADALGNDVVAHRSVPTALWVAAVSETIEDGVPLALGLGGDADTIAAMAGAVLGGAGGRSTIPSAWQAALEDGRRGRTHLVDLARRLDDAHDQLVA